MIKSDKIDVPAPALQTDIDGVTLPGKPERSGNYSCVGYQKLNIPQSEAEKWNMPFTDPEFSYDSIS